jgi:selenocysteine-specific elongation factor
VTVGTAGHIDHGKTALVEALTGAQTDRLAEERRRGMSIELGYAELVLDGRRFSLIDVPGHERFVRTMIAGATGIDVFLLVVAADDGVMPQTLEHLAVLQALGVDVGAVALSKVDLVADETRDRVEAAIHELLPSVPIVGSSVRTGEGIGDLRGCLSRVADETLARRLWSNGKDGEAEPAAEPVLHVDRVFSLTGHGTVVTGTLWSGTLRRGDRVMVLPNRREARIRSIQSHDRPIEMAGPRRRVALNLAGLRREDVARGDVVTTPEAKLAPTFRLDVALMSGGLAGLTERRVQVHHGTREVPGRIVDLGEGAVQLRLEQPLLAHYGDRVVLRRIAPPTTLDGGSVLDPSPPRHGRSSRLIEQSRSKHPVPGPSPEVEKAEPGRLARRLLGELKRDATRPRTPAKLAEDLDAPRGSVERALGELVDTGAAQRLNVDVVYPVAEAARLQAEVTRLALDEGATSIAEVRDALGLSRKYAQALLEHLNREGVLRRDGDRHYPGAAT